MSKKNKDDDCIELKNIKYQTMLINNNTNKIKSPTLSNIENFLDKERSHNNLQQWSKLSIMTKKKKLKLFTEIFSEKNKLSSSDKDKLYKYLIKSLEQKKLQKIKDVTYDISKGEIINIPILLYNNNTNKYYLKNEKRISSLKSLAPKSKKKSKTKIKTKIKTTSKNKNNSKMKSKK
tara:strand:+ start:11754 stop:12284 length:531 start_codon:yes stop_codon:yes gene_type:complete